MGADSAPGPDGRDAVRGRSGRKSRRRIEVTAARSPDPLPAMSRLAVALVGAAIVLPMAAVLFLADPLLPEIVFVVAAIPATLALLWTRQVQAPRSLVLGAAVLVVVGLLLSTFVNDMPNPRILVALLLRGVLVLWFLSLLAVAFALDGRGATRLILALAAVCAASAAVNLYLFFTLPLAELPVEAQVRFAPIIGLVSGSFSTTASATYAVFAAGALAVAFAPQRGHAARVAAGVATLVLLVALALTQTRSAYLAIAAAGIAVAACLSRPMRYVILAMLVAAVIVVFLYPPAYEVVVQRGASYRPGTWAHFLPAFLDRPLLGIGQRVPIRITVEGAPIHHPHNMLLSAQVRGGILACVGLAGMLVGALVWAWRFARGTGNAAVLAMVSALAVASLFDFEAKVTPADWVWLTIWVPLGLAAGCEVVLRRRAAVAPAPSAATGAGCHR